MPDMDEAYGSERERREWAQQRDRKERKEEKQRRGRLKTVLEKMELIDFDFKKRGYCLDQCLDEESNLNNNRWYIQKKKDNQNIGKIDAKNGFIIILYQTENNEIDELENYTLDEYLYQIRCAEALALELRYYGFTKLIYTPSKTETIEKLESLIKHIK